VPEATGPHNSFYRNMDVSISYPVRLARLREGMSLVPGIAFYNVANFANFNDYTNGPNSFADHDINRVQRGSGTSDIGGPRTTEFQLKLNF
jgi:hypothetical protein